MGMLADFFTQYTPILRWWFMFSAMCLGFFFAHEAGFIQRFIDRDLTHISLIIFCIFIFFTLLTGYDTYKINKSAQKFKNICKHAKLSWFMADVVLTLGMAGTVIGFVWMLEGELSIDQASLESMKQGMGIALYTTIAGIIASLLMKLQLFNLDLCLEEVDKKTAVCEEDCHE